MLTVIIEMYAIYSKYFIMLLKALTRNLDKLVDFDYSLTINKILCYFDNDLHCVELI